MKIIHVDMNRQALQAMREDLPRIVPEAELHSFSDPDQALAFALGQGCDVLLTEIELWSERLGGIRLAKAIKEINPRVHIIFATAWDENEVVRELSGLTVNGFLPKLWAPEELAAAFQNLCCPVNEHITM